MSKNRINELKVKNIIKAQAENSVNLEGRRNWTKFLGFF